MTVKDLLDGIERARKEHKDILEWDVYAEQCSEEDKAFKRCEQGWKILIGRDCGQDVEYFECAGEDGGIWEEKKALIIYINY